MITSVSNFLESLHPDQRADQLRMFEQVPAMRDLYEAAAADTPDGRRIAAQLQQVLVSGEYPEGEIFERLSKEMLAYEQAVRDERAQARGLRSSVISYAVSHLGRLYDDRRTIEAKFARLEPKEQAVYLHLLELASGAEALAQDDPELTTFLAQPGEAMFDQILETTNTNSFAAFALPTIATTLQQLRNISEEPSDEWPDLMKDFFVDMAALIPGASIAPLYSPALPEMIWSVLEKVADPNEDAWPHLLEIVESWQRLLWIYLSLDEDGLLMGVRREPFPDDDDVAAKLLLALSREAHVLAAELSRCLPRDPSAYLPSSVDGEALLESINVRCEEELLDEFVSDIFENRRYTLDHVARIELGGRYGIERLTLSPERRRSDLFGVEFIVEHKKGTFCGQTIIANNDDIRDAITTVPVLHEQRISSHELAPVTALVLAAWRNLVVPRVRDEHYEQTTVRKPKGSGKRAARQQRRGDVLIVSYLPRTLSLRRAEEAERRSNGNSTPLRTPHRVGNFSKRLPEGHKRTSEAEAYAQLIGIPLADWQTVVRSHWRGGTEEERERAEACSSVSIREWRSWDALDLIAA